MRIPTSVIVMACVTAIPFGLAIRSTVVERREKAESEALAKRLERERQQERIDEELLETKLAEAAKAKHEALLASLIGKDRASLGSAFGFALDDAPTGDALAKLDVALQDLSPVFERGKDDRVIGVRVTIGDDCEAMRARVAAAWGTGEADWSWQDPAHHHRLTIDTAECYLHFTDYVDVGEWLKQVPTDFVGKPIGDVLRVMGPAQEMTDDELTWHLPGVPGGSQTTTYRLHVTDNVVHQISANTDVMPEEVQPLIDTATARFKSRPALDDETGTRVWTWKRTPPTSIESDSSMFLLQIGTYE